MVFNGTNIGTPNASRYLVVGVYAYRSSTSGYPTMTINSISVNGTTITTQYAADTRTYSAAGTDILGNPVTDYYRERLAFFVTASTVPTGTTADISVSITDGFARIFVWTVTGSKNISVVASTIGASGTIATQTGGTVMGLAYDVSGLTPVWTGLSNPTSIGGGLYVVANENAVSGTSLTYSVTKTEMESLISIGKA